MQCMTAIWPAGPPKLWMATRSQTRTASEKGTASGALTPRPPLPLHPSTPAPGEGETCSWLAVVFREGGGAPRPGRVCLGGAGEGSGVRASRQPSQRLVQPLEQRDPVPLQLLVEPACRQPAPQDTIDPGGFGRRGEPVPQVDLV